MRVVVLALASWACATPAESRAMVAPAVALQAPQLRGAIAITRVAGGEETNPMWSSNVGDRQFEEALRWSLENSGYLAPDGVRPLLSLEATLVELKKPASGFTMTVDSFIRYRRVSNRDGAVLFDEILTASYTADISAAFYGVTRLRLVIEGSVRENIAAFLARLNSIAEAAK